MIDFYQNERKSLIDCIKILIRFELSSEENEKNQLINETVSWLIDQNLEEKIFLWLQESISMKISTTFKV